MSQLIKKVTHAPAVSDPALRSLQAQTRYQKRGYRRRWIGNRLGTAGTRRELASEWHRRGATGSEHFRALTNGLVHAAFGMDVQQFREYKGLSGRRRGNLRDLMTDLELALLGLAEAAAIELSRGRGSSTFEALLADVSDAGAIVAKARQTIERGRLISPKQAA